ncbi:MAG: Mini-ribonuclease 3 [Clostridiales Family XIII bacterium]|jgi:ribonuclease-3 family protein|nr:Mini-ribonuclease 3 [Clostridiales Family XIII bacterium]
METDAIRMNTTMLAWLGDAAYDLKIREYIAGSGRGAGHADIMHRKAVRYVRAEAQAKVMREIVEELPPEEQALVRRARNKRISTKPKNADPVQYKWATAFEALIGYYLLAGLNERIDDAVRRAIEITDKERREG